MANLIKLTPLHTTEAIAYSVDDIKKVIKVPAVAAVPPAVRGDPGTPGSPESAVVTFSDGSFVETVETRDAIVAVANA